MSSAPPASVVTRCVAAFAQREESRALQPVDAVIAIRIEALHHILEDRMAEEVRML